MKADVHPGTIENLLVSDGFTPVISMDRRNTFIKFLCG